MTIENRRTRRYWVGSNSGNDKYNRSLENRVIDLLDPSFLMNWKVLLEENNLGKKGINSVKEKVESKDIFLRPQENHGRGDKGQQARLHSSGDCTEDSVLQHPKRDDTCLLNWSRHFSKTISTNLIQKQSYSLHKFINFQLDF